MNLGDFKKSNARELLLEAAKRLFIERGCDSVSTREIADAAGVNLGAIQYYFGSKAGLFVETVRHLMENTGYAEGESILKAEASSREAAARQLGRFIQHFLGELLRPCGSQPCRMMVREIFTGTSRDKEMFEALVSTVVKDFIRPVDEALVALIQKLAPRYSLEERQFAAQSIVGQCHYYLTHAPFVARLREVEVSKSPYFEALAAHVTRFSLRGLGFSEDEIATCALSQEGTAAVAVKSINSECSLCESK